MKVKLSQISFIVIEPRTPGNIGSIARAMKNMGLASLILVNPCEYEVPETYRLGWAAEDIISAIKVVKSLDELLPQFDILVGTTNRHRSLDTPTVAPKKIVQDLIPLSQNNRIGFLFGRENNGLTNDELNLCNFISAIPQNTNYPALNLSQAAMVYAYELFQASEKNHSYELKAADKSAEELMYQKLTEAIKTLPFTARKGAVDFTNLFRRILGRTTLEQRDINLLLKLIDLIIKK